ncbi:PLP-dependent aminotransferase family protein [Actinomadura coerulea]|uniref:MocR-like pyridoxine biosynthesis transcription factor PdxR n=1 Tax=Actinomadura coerulea TaxID=46159 RepID=UPI0034366CD7
MAIRRSTFSADLALVDIDQRPERTLTARLEGSLRDAIRSRRLREGVALPSSRHLASELGCSRWVVVQAYEQLIAEGYLQATQGGATRVCELSWRAAPQEPVIEQPVTRYRIDLTAGQPDISAFPASAWARATQTVLASTEWDDLHYIDPSGIEAFKISVCELLGRTRGVVAEPDHVHATAGATHAIGLVCRAAARAGHTKLAVEDPGWPPLRDFASAAGLELVSIPIDEDGIKVEVLERHPDVRMVLVTPAHQFPTGVVLSAERRQALVHWADAVGGLVLEDAYDAEFRYDKRPVGCLQGMAPGQVAFVGSSTKLLAPGVRLGWLVLPGRWNRMVVEAREGIDLGVSALVQLIFAELVDNGQLERHLNRSRRLYRARRARMLEALDKYLPALETAGIAAGLHLLVRLPEEIDEGRLVSEAGRRGVKVYGLGRYDHGTSERRGLVLGYARATATSIEEGVRILAECCAGLE